MAKHRLNNNDSLFAHHGRMQKRRQSYHDYQDTMPALHKSELLLTGKYIPAGQYKNV